MKALPAAVLDDMYISKAFVDTTIVQESNNTRNLLMDTNDGRTVNHDLVPSRCDAGLNGRLLNSEVDIPTPLKEASFPTD